MKTISTFWCAVILFFAANINQPYARMAPEFGPSLTWDTDGEKPSLTAMRGKSVIIIFFQSWCGICNGWSGRVFDQINKNLKEEPSTVLIAIKTDGGSMAEAKSYLGERMDHRNWLVALDEGAAYYRQATGKTSLYRYMWVKPDGEIQMIESASMGYAAPGGKAYVLGTKKRKKELKKGTETVFKSHGEVSGALQPALKKAEQGLFLSALKLAAKSNADKAELQTFRATLAGKVEEMVAHHGQVLADDISAARYLSYLALENLAEGFGNSSPGKSARKFVSAQARKPWLKDEQDAQKDYLSIQKKAARADDERSRARITRALTKLSEEYPSTYYGQLASGVTK